MFNTSPISEKFFIPLNSIIEYNNNVCIIQSINNNNLFGVQINNIIAKMGKYILYLYISSRNKIIFECKYLTTGQLLKNGHNYIMLDIPHNCDDFFSITIKSTNATNKNFYVYHLYTIKENSEILMVNIEEKIEEKIKNILDETKKSNETSNLNENDLVYNTNKHELNNQNNYINNEKFSFAVKIIDLFNNDHLGKIWALKNIDKLNNYRDLFKLRNENELSKIFHFVWIGDNPIPPEYIEYIESWINNHPNWKYCFWNDMNIPNLINNKEYNEATKFAMKADILRYEILYIFGGVYVDCDFLCFKNIENMINGLKGFSAWESKDFIAIGLMGFCPGHKFLGDVISLIPDNVRDMKNEKNVSQVTGPVMFTKLWTSKKYDDLYAFPPDFCYGFTYQDHYFNREYIRKDEHYAIHMWGNSWGDGYKNKENSIDHVCKYVLSKKMLCNIPNYEIFDNIKKQIKQNVLFNANIENKKNILHIIGYFFAGGIERLIQYFGKYGDMEKFNYYLMYMPYAENKYYTIDNMQAIPYNSHLEGNLIIKHISPDVIIDHVSIYFSDNDTLYSDYPREKIINIIHGAYKYKMDIDYLKIHNCIHLYDEQNKHPSWNKIQNNYIIHLGTELPNIPNKTVSGDKINVSIIGRISDEKIPVDFLKMLCEFSKSSTNMNIKIYGGKPNHRSSLLDAFDSLICDSNVEYKGHIDQNEIFNIYLNNDILLIPSVYETGSFACIEALSYGNVVIGRNNFGMATLVKPEYGYLCNSNEELIDTLKNITIDDIYNKSNIALKISIKYDITITVKNIENIYSNIINAGNKNI